MSLPGGASTLAVPSSLVEAQTVSGAVGVLAPLAAGLPEGTCFAVQDSSAMAGINPITIGGNGTLIDGAASLVLSTNAEIAVLVLDSGQWRRLVPERSFSSSDKTFDRTTELSGGSGASSPFAVPTIVSGRASRRRETT